VHVKGFLHKLLSNTIHKSRLKSLSEAVEASITSKQLSLTAMGRAISLPIQERSGIQKINRLLGNENLRKDYLGISKSVSEWLIGFKKSPLIIVDWTKYPNSHDSVLRAAVEVYGRAITLYEERHGENNTGKREILKRFLLKLREVLPEKCSPIIVTDAGFNNYWFRQIIKMNWNYISRVRGKKMYRDPLSKTFKPCYDLYKTATKEEKSLGKKILTSSNPLETYCYTIKQPSKRRRARGKIPSQKDSRDYAKSQREPWLLVSSLSGRKAEKKVIAAYKRRMGIEEAFRDLKSSQYGLGLEMSRTRKKTRRDIILLIAMLANLVVVLTGIAAEKIKLQFQFQSNSLKNRRVISIFYLGCQIIKKKISIPIPSIMQIFTEIQLGVSYES
jgi:hypothetical protein